MYSALARHPAKYGLGHAPHKLIRIQALERFLRRVRLRGVFRLPYFLYNTLLPRQYSCMFLLRAREGRGYFFLARLLCPHFNHIYRAARSGILTGVLLAVARITGETAPLLFTALNNQFFSTDLGAPMANLPVVIFQFALSPYDDWQKIAWGGALIITVAILALNVIARALAGGGKQQS